MPITDGSATGGVRLMLRMEGLAVLVAAVLAYNAHGLGWGIFAIFFLAPDLFMLGYLAGSRVGAIAYNAAHSYVGALALTCVGLFAGHPVALGAGLIWCAHIGFDRLLGYGLKYAGGFGFTHLGRIGRERPRT